MVSFKEKVGSHHRRLGRGKSPNRIIPVSSFKRKVRSKRVKFIRPMKKKYEVTYYQDDFGRIVSKRKYKHLD